MQDELIDTLKHEDDEHECCNSKCNWLNADYISEIHNKKVVDNYNKYRYWHGRDMMP